MRKIEELLNEIKALSGTDKPKELERMNALAVEIKALMTDEDKPLVKEFMDEWVCEMEADVADIRSQIAKEDYKLLPLAYIAKNYFGKSASWLSQRINGSKVRGKSYTLNQEQKLVFNKALKEIGNRIGSLSIA